MSHTIVFHCPSRVCERHWVGIGTALLEERVGENAFVLKCPSCVSVLCACDNCGALVLSPYHSSSSSSTNAMIAPADAVCRRCGFPSPSSPSVRAFLGLAPLVPLSWTRVRQVQRFLAGASYTHKKEELYHQLHSTETKDSLSVTGTHGALAGTKRKQVDEDTHTSSAATTITREEDEKSESTTYHPTDAESRKKRLRDGSDTLSRTHAPLSTSDSTSAPPLPPPLPLPLVPSLPQPLSISLEVLRAQLRDLRDPTLTAHDTRIARMCFLPPGGVPSAAASYVIPNSSSSSYSSALSFSSSASAASADSLPHPLHATSSPSFLRSLASAPFLNALLPASDRLHSFMPCHLKMLVSLYEQTEESEQSLFLNMSQFLCERHALLSLKQQTVTAEQAWQRARRAQQSQRPLVETKSTSAPSPFSSTSSAELDVYGLLTSILHARYTRQRAQLQALARRFLPVLCSSAHHMSQLYGRVETALSTYSLASHTPLASVLTSHTHTLPSPSSLSSPSPGLDVLAEVRQRLALLASLYWCMSATLL